jgi:hypothetical protein
VRVLVTIVGCGALLSGCGQATFGDRPATLHFADPKQMKQGPARRADAAEGAGKPALVDGRPRSSADQTTALTRAEVLKLNTEDVVLEYYYGLQTEEDRRAFRDLIIWRQLRADDKSFGDFTRKLQSDRALANLSGDGGVIFLNGLAAMTGTAADKAALSILSAMLISSRGSVDRELFYAQTMSALLTRMAAARKEASVPILNGIGQSDAAYPLDRALRDLFTYADAGSLLSALRAITTDAGVADRKAEAAVVTEVRDESFLSSLDAREKAFDRVAVLNRTQLIGLVGALESYRAGRPAPIRAKLFEADEEGLRFSNEKRAKFFLNTWLNEDPSAGGPDWIKALDQVEKATP